MPKHSKKRAVGSAVVSAAVLLLDLSTQHLRAASPTTVFSASSSVGFDGTNFTSLTLGVNTPLSPNALVNLDGSLLTGIVTDSASASGFNYQELYSVNLSDLSVSIVAFNDSNHQIVDPNYGNVFSPSLAITSSSGTIVGIQSTTAASSDGSEVIQSTGTDVFTSNNGAAPVMVPLPITPLGGTGEYSYTSSQTGTSVHVMSVNIGSENANSFATNAIGPGGIVVGQVHRYSSDGSGTLVGIDGFYYNPSTGNSTAIGLVGGEYSGNSVTGTAGDAATGFTELVDSSGSRAGYDGWIYTPTSGTVQIGLVGGPYTYNNGTTYEFTQIFRTNSIGQIAGRSSYVSAAGDPLSSPTVDAWLYTPSSTPGTASAFGTSSAGTYARLGFATYPSGSTLGYTNPVGGSTYAANFRYTNETFLANNGNAAGQSDRFDSSGNFEGLAAWYYNGSTNTDISPGSLNPSDAVHAAVAGGTVFSTDSITAMNNTGMAAGYATRIAGTASGSASLGQDAYIYDSNIGREFFVDPSDEASTSKYAYSYVGTLSDSGYAVGFYNTYSGSTGGTQTNTTIFVWSELGKLVPLYSFTNTSAGNNSALQAYVGSFEMGSDGELYSPNAYSGATSLVAYGLNVTWNNSLGTGDGQHWDFAGQNWTNGVIPLVYLDSAKVTFNDSNNGHYAVIVNSIVSPNAVTFNNSAGNYTFSGTGGIGGGGGLTKMGTASVTLGISNSYTGATNVSGGSLILAAAGALPIGTNLTIGSGASVVADDLGTSIGLTVSSLTVAGKLDLNNNGLVVHGGLIGTVTSLVQSGYNHGKWNGSTGIVSTTAATNASQLTALGVIINDTGANSGISSGTPLYTTLDGAATTDGDILIKYTYYGDANLDGQVDGSDYSLIDNGFNNHLSGWYNGDFNYDGKVDGSDYTLIDNAFNSQGSSFAISNDTGSAGLNASSATRSATSAVPEPSIIGLIWMLLLGHRRPRGAGSPSGQ